MIMKNRRSFIIGIKSTALSFKEKNFILDLSEILNNTNRIKEILKNK